MLSDSASGSRAPPLGSALLTLSLVIPRKTRGTQYGGLLAMLYSYSYSLLVQFTYLFVILALLKMGTKISVRTLHVFSSTYPYALREVLL